MNDDCGYGLLSSNADRRQVIVSFKAGNGTCIAPGLALYCNGARPDYFLSLGVAHVAEICSTFVAVNTARPFSVVVFPVSLTV